jgi:hypothetical protein
VDSDEKLEKVKRSGGKAGEGKEEAEEQILKEADTSNLGHRRADRTEGKIPDDVDSVSARGASPACWG